MTYRNLEKLAADTDVLRRFARQHIWNAPNRTTQSMGQLYQIAPPPQPIIVDGRLQPPPTSYYSLDRDTLGLHGAFENPGARLGAALHENNERKVGLDLSRKLESVGGPVAAINNGLRLPHDVLPTSSHLAASLPLRDLNIANTAWGPDAGDMSAFLRALRQRRWGAVSEIEDLTDNVPGVRPLLENAGLLATPEINPPQSMRHMARRASGEDPRAEGHMAFDQRGMPLDFLTSAQIISRVAGHVSPEGENLIGRRFDDRLQEIAKKHPEGSDAHHEAFQAAVAQRAAEYKDQEMLERLATNMNLRAMLTGAGTLPPPSPAYMRYFDHTLQKLETTHSDPPHRLNRNELRMVDDSFNRTYNPDFPQLLAKRVPSPQTPATPLPAEQRSAFREALAAQPGLTRKQFLARRG